MKKFQKIPSNYYCSGPEQRAKDFRRQRWLYGTPSRTLHRSKARRLVKKLTRLFEFYSQTAAARAGVPHSIATTATDLRIGLEGRLYDGRLTVRSSGSYFLEIRLEKGNIYVFRSGGRLSSGDSALVLDRRLPQCSRFFGMNCSQDFFAQDPVMAELVSQTQVA